jgi:hypothetical protein
VPEDPSKGIFRWTISDNEQVWDRFDYGDTLPMSSERASLVNQPVGTPETHKCFFLHLAAGLLFMQHQRLPTLLEAQGLASTLLDEFQQQAEPADALLGEPPEKKCQAESDLRVFLHDLACSDHDTDYRLPAAFPLSRLPDFRLCFARVDSQYQASLDAITGLRHAGSSKRCIGLHAKNGHLTLLVPTGQFDPPHFARDIPAVDWEAHLESAIDSPAAVTVPDLQPDVRASATPELLVPVMPFIMWGVPILS